MLKRALFLCLGLWLIAASGLAAHAGPCDMRGADRGMSAAHVMPDMDAHAHCDMMAPATEDTGQDMPDVPDQGSACCCPAVLAAVAAPAMADTGAPDFTLPAGFPADIRAPTRTLIPEPPPPKA